MRSAKDMIASQRAIADALDRGETPRLKDHIPMGTPGPMARAMERHAQSEQSLRNDAIRSGSLTTWIGYENHRDGGSFWSDLLAGLFG